MQSIEQKIKEKGVTKAHVAKMVGVAESTLSRIIKGNQKYVSDELISKIHRYLDGLNTNDKI